jgi:hypothetical protein
MNPMGSNGKQKDHQTRAFEAAFPSFTGRNKYQEHDDKQ